MASPNPVMRMSTKMILRTTRTPRVEATPPASEPMLYVEWIVFLSEALLPLRSRRRIDEATDIWLPTDGLRCIPLTSSPSGLKLTLLLGSFRIPGRVSALSSSPSVTWIVILQRKVFQRNILILILMPTLDLELPGLP